MAIEVGIYRLPDFKHLFFKLYYIKKTEKYFVN